MSSFETDFFSFSTMPEIYLMCCIYRQFIPLYGWGVFHSMDVPDYFTIYVLMAI